MVYLSFIQFVCVVYALCFLAADARIFGGDAAAYNELENEGASELDWFWWRHLGVIRIRPVLMRLRFVREHLSCYFCMGIWAGPAAHLLLWWFYRDHLKDYCFQHANTADMWALGFGVTFLVGSACSYVVHTSLNWFEVHT